MQALLEPWQGETGGVWDGFEGKGSATGTCSASEMVGPSTTPCAVPYEFRGLSRGEGGVSMCVSEEDGNPPWCQASSGRVDCVCPNAGDVWDGVKSGFARLRFTSVTEDCPPGTYYDEARAWSHKQDSSSVLPRPFRPVCVPCPSGTFSRVVGATSSAACTPCPPNSVSAAGSSTCSCVAGFFGPGDTDGGCTPCGANADSPSVSPFASPAAAEAGVAAAFSRYMSEGSREAIESDYGPDAYHNGELTQEYLQSAASSAARELAGHGSPKTCVCNAGYTGDPVVGCTPCADSGALTCTCSHRQACARPVPMSWVTKSFSVTFVPRTVTELLAPRSARRPLDIRRQHGDNHRLWRRRPGLLGAPRGLGGWHPT